MLPRQHHNLRKWQIPVTFLKEEKLTCRKTAIERLQFFVLFRGIQNDKRYDFITSCVGVLLWVSGLVNADIQ